MLESNEVLDAGQAGSAIGFDAKSVSDLKRARGWAQFLSIFYYIVFGLVIVSLLLTVVGMGRMAGSGYMTFMVVALLTYLVVLFLMAQALGNVSSSIRQLGFNYASSKNTDRVCAAQKGLFRAMGIIMIVGILFVVGFVIFGGNIMYFLMYNLSM